MILYKIKRKRFKIFLTSTLNEKLKSLFKTHSIKWLINNYKLNQLNSLQLELNLSYVKVCTFNLRLSI